VKRAGIHDKTQEMAQQRRLLDSVLSNCTFNRGSVCPTYKEPFDLFAQANWRMAGSTGLEPDLLDDD
jgi:hypothetical protein